MATIVTVATMVTPVTLGLSLSLAGLQDQVVLAVRQQYVSIGDQSVILADGDEVAVVPPLSGG